MRISDWSSDVCSSDLIVSQVSADDRADLRLRRPARPGPSAVSGGNEGRRRRVIGARRQLLRPTALGGNRSDEHTPELQPLMRISSAVFCLKPNNQTTTTGSSTTSPR